MFRARQLCGHATAVRWLIRLSVGAQHLRKVVRHAVERQTEREQAKRNV